MKIAVIVVLMVDINTLAKITKEMQIVQTSQDPFKGFTKDLPQGNILVTISSGIMDLIRMS